MTTFLQVQAWIFSTDHQLTLMRFSLPAYIKQQKSQNIESSVQNYCCRFISLVPSESCINDLYQLLMKSLQQQYPDIPSIQIRAIQTMDGFDLPGAMTLNQWREALSLNEKIELKLLCLLNDPMCAMDFFTGSFTDNGSPILGMQSSVISAAAKTAVSGKKKQPAQQQKQKQPQQKQQQQQKQQKEAPATQQKTGQKVDEKGPVSAADKGKRKAESDDKPTKAKNKKAKKEKPQTPSEDSKKEKEMAPSAPSTQAQTAVTPEKSATIGAPTIEPQSTKENTASKTVHVAATTVSEPLPSPPKSKVASQAKETAVNSTESTATNANASPSSIPEKKSIEVPLTPPASTPIKSADDAKESSDSSSDSDSDSSDSDSSSSDDDASASDSELPISHEHTPFTSAHHLNLPPISELKFAPETPLHLFKVHEEPASKTKSNRTHLESSSSSSSDSDSSSDSSSSDSSDSDVDVDKKPMRVTRSKRSGGMSALVRDSR